MTASLALQATIVEALRSLGELTGTYDGPPPRAPFPYATVDASIEIDWGHKSGEGREIPVAITLWDDRPERLAQLSGRAEAAINAVAAVSGWQLVSLRFVRRRTIRSVAGPWAAALDFRARLLLLQGD